MPVESHVGGPGTQLLGVAAQRGACVNARLPCVAQGCLSVRDLIGNAGKGPWDPARTLGGTYAGCRSAVHMDCHLPEKKEGRSQSTRISGSGTLRISPVRVARSSRS